MSTTDSTARARDDAAIIERVENELMSGRTFALVAAGSRSITGYQPPTESRRYADAVAVLAKYASISDSTARLAARIIPHIPVCGTAGDSVAQMYQAAVNALGKPWHDTAAAASPEPGRPSDHYHEWKLSDRLLLKVALANAQACLMPTGSRHGWAFQALVQREVEAHRLAAWAVERAGGVS